MERDQLKALVEEGLTHREIALAADRSISTVRYWIRRHGLEQRRQFRRLEVKEAARTGAPLIRRCRHHGKTEYALVGSEQRPRCKKCRSEAVARRRRRTKAILVAELGGACAICGYRRSLEALEFHHVDPADKSFGISFGGVTRGIEALRAEAEKCVLLCANCHAEVEAGVASLPDDASPPG